MNIKNTYIQLYKLIFYALLNKIITEERYIKFFQKLNELGFKTYHIDDFDNLLNLLPESKSSNAYNISFLLNCRDKYNKYSLEIIKLFPDIANIYTIESKNFTQKMEHTVKILNDKKLILSSFRKMTGFILSETLTTEKNKACEAMQIYYMKKEIINRLHLIVRKHFKLKQLVFMKVKLVLLSELQNLSLAKLQEYYINVINKIDTSLNEIINIYTKYINLEINYTKCCISILSNKKYILPLFI